MKRYCKKLALTRQVIEDGYADWLSCESGKKNGWRVRKEYGTAAALLDEIEREIRDRSLTFRPLHSYDKVDGTSGKVRHITVESVKQQVCDHIAVVALMPMLRARVGRQQYGSTKGRGRGGRQAPRRALHPAPSPLRTHGRVPLLREHAHRYGHGHP